MDLPFFFPGVSGTAAAVCAALPPRESSLPAAGEEGWGWSRERYNTLLHTTSAEYKQAATRGFVSNGSVLVLRAMSTQSWSYKSYYIGRECRSTIEMKWYEHFVLRLYWPKKVHDKQGVSSSLTVKLKHHVSCLLEFDGNIYLLIDGVGSWIRIVLGTLTLMSWLWSSLCSFRCHCNIIMVLLYQHNERPCCSNIILYYIDNK